MVLVGFDQVLRLLLSQKTGEAVVPGLVVLDIEFACLRESGREQQMKRQTPLDPDPLGPFRVGLPGPSCFPIIGQAIHQPLKVFEVLMDDGFCRLLLGLAQRPEDLGGLPRAWTGWVDRGAFDGKRFLPGFTQGVRYDVSESYHFQFPPFNFRDPLYDDGNSILFGPLDARRSGRR